MSGLLVRKCIAIMTCVTVIGWVLGDHSETKLFQKSLVRKMILA
jgi:hypothetical protein